MRIPNSINWFSLSLKLSSRPQNPNFFTLFSSPFCIRKDMNSTLWIREREKFLRKLNEKSFHLCVICEQFFSPPRRRRCHLQWKIPSEIRIKSLCDFRFQAHTKEMSWMSQSEGCEANRLLGGRADSTCSQQVKEKNIQKFYFPYRWSIDWWIFEIVIIILLMLNNNWSNDRGFMPTAHNLCVHRKNRAQPKRM